MTSTTSSAASKKKKPISRRLEQSIEPLTTARETELDPPPSLKSAFARNHQTRRGWELMPH